MYVFSVVVYALISKSAVGLCRIDVDTYYVMYKTALPCGDMNKKTEFMKLEEPHRKKHGVGARVSVASAALQLLKR